MQKAALVATMLALSFGLAPAINAEDQKTPIEDGQAPTESGHGLQGANGPSRPEPKNGSQTPNAQSPGGQRNPTMAPNGPIPAGQDLNNQPNQNVKQKSEAPPSVEKPVYVRTYGSNAASGYSTRITPAPSGRAAAGQTKTPAGLSVKSNQNDDIVTITDSSAYKIISAKNQWQTFPSNIILTQGQDQLPLTLTVTSQGLTGVNLSLSGSSFATSRDFKKGVFSRNVSGALGLGVNQLIAQITGPPGAKLSWKLTALRSAITEIKPGETTLGGKVTINGHDFAQAPGGNYVTVGGKLAKVINATNKMISFIVPNNAPTGKQKVVVNVGGVLSKPAELTIKTTPELISTNILEGPPTQAFTIKGKGFSPKASDNIVMVAGKQAPIISCSSDSISCLIPSDAEFPQRDVPVTVKSCGVSATGILTISITQRVIPNPADD